MATEETKDPELATNEHWRDEMILARKAAGMTQDQLGTRVGATQVSISKIESGENGSSTFILPICRVLKIHPPEHYATSDDREFMRELAKVRREKPDQYKAVIALVHSIVDGAAKR